MAVAILIPLRDDLDTGSIALVLLLPPLVASNGGRVLSLLSALISALAFNFLFTQPYNSFRIESSASIAAFVVYMFMSVTLAILAARLRDARALANRRARNASLLGEPEVRQRLADLGFPPGDDQEEER